MSFTEDLAAVVAVRQLDEVFVRFWLKVDTRGPDECWPWLGALNEQGYGTFSIGRRGSTAHRFAYEFAVGPIPAAAVLDHTCHTVDLGCTDGDRCAHRACCNPAHLEPVTNTENLRRKHNANAAKARCKRGHALTPENTGRHAGTGWRYCLACARERDRRRRPSIERPT